MAVEAQKNTSFGNGVAQERPVPTDLADKVPRPGMLPTSTEGAP